MALERRRLKILQIGLTGQVAMELLARGPGRGHAISALGRQQIDLAEPDKVAAAIATGGPYDIVINGAAYTAVDKAEADAELAMKVNAESVAAIARACNAGGSTLIHLSTDYVFDGMKDAPYVEDDPTNPLSVYGRSKLAGEMAVRAHNPKHIILRTSWVYSAFGTNFVKTMLRLGREREELKVVDDQWGSPTAAGDVAAVCLDLAERIAVLDEPRHYGTYHFVGAGATTWCRFAQAIFELSAAWSGCRARVVPIPSDAYPTAATRPKNSRLDTRRIERTFGVTPRPWRSALTEVLAEIRSLNAEQTR